MKMMTLLSKKPDKFYLGFTSLKQRLFRFDTRYRFAFPSPWRRAIHIAIFVRISREHPPMLPWLVWAIQKAGMTSSLQIQAFRRCIKTVHLLYQKRGKRNCMNSH